MPVEEGKHRASYTMGEAKALLAPLMGCTAEDLGDVLIMARSSDGQKIGVFHTMYCQHEQHEDCRALDMVGEFIQHQAATMYERGPQHGPGGKVDRGLDSVLSLSHGKRRARDHSISRRHSRQVARGTTGSSV